MNKKNVRGYTIVKRRFIQYKPALKVLGRHYEFELYPTANEAREVYVKFSSTVFEIINALSTHGLPFDIQRLIMDFWIQRLRGQARGKGSKKKNYARLLKMLAESEAQSSAVAVRPDMVVSPLIPVILPQIPPRIPELCAPDPRI